MVEQGSTSSHSIHKSNCLKLPFSFGPGSCWCPSCQQKLLGKQEPSPQGLKTSGETVVQLSQQQLPLATFLAAAFTTAWVAEGLALAPGLPIVLTRANSRGPITKALEKNSWVNTKHKENQCKSWKSFNAEYLWVWLLMTHCSAEMWASSGATHWASWTSQSQSQRKRGKIRKIQN